MEFFERVYDEEPVHVDDGCVYAKLIAFKFQKKKYTLNFLNLCWKSLNSEG